VRDATDSEDLKTEDQQALAEVVWEALHFQGMGSSFRKGHHSNEKTKQKLTITSPSILIDCYLADKLSILTPASHLLVF
jgi:hypothetical protein